MWLDRLIRSNDALRRLARRGKMALVRRWYGLRHVHPTFYMGGAGDIARDFRAGPHSYVGRDCCICPRVSIGAYTILAHEVSIQGGDHRYDMPGTPIYFSGRPPLEDTVIEEDVWIGHRAIVKAGVRVGRGASHRRGRRRHEGRAALLDRRRRAGTADRRAVHRPGGPPQAQPGARPAHRRRPAARSEGARSMASLNTAAADALTVAVQYPSLRPVPQRPPERHRPAGAARGLARGGDGDVPRGQRLRLGPVDCAGAPFVRHTVMDCTSEVGRRMGRALRRAVRRSLDEHRAERSGGQRLGPPREPRVAGLGRAARLPDRAAERQPARQRAPPLVEGGRQALGRAQLPLRLRGRPAPSALRAGTRHPAAQHPPSRARAWWTTTSGARPRDGCARTRNATAPWQACRSATS